MQWENIIAALEYFNDESDSSLNKQLSELRAAWASYPFRRMKIMQFSQEDSAEANEIEAWDSEIARAYLYGDLVHGDDNAELLDALENKQVIFSASAMVSDGFKLTNNMYQVMHQLRPDIAPENAFFIERELS